MEILIFGAIFAIVLIASLFLIPKLRGNGQKEPIQTNTDAVKTPNTGKNGKKDSALLQKPEVSYGPIHIYFGTQTGNAQNLANILGEEAIQQGFEPQVIDLGTCPPESIKEAKLAIFSVSTYGEGEPPESIKPFDEWLISSERAPDEFTGVKYTVFALGNRQYQFYCAQGKRVDESMEKLGAERVYVLGMGDDNESLEDDFNAWKENLWTELKKYVSSTGVQKTTNNKAHKDELPFNITYLPGEKEIDVMSHDPRKDNRSFNFQAKQFLSCSNAKIVLSRELRQKTDDGSTLHMEIDLGSTGLTYQTAQNLYLYPENGPEIVERTAKLLGLDLDAVFALETKNNDGSHVKFEHPFPSPISVRTFLTRFCDLQGPLKKKQLKELAPFCANEDHKKQLLYLASNEGKTEFEVQIHSRLKCLVEIIEDFNIKLPFGNFVSISSHIIPRYYTIASSSKKHPNVVHLCVSIYADRLQDMPVKYGLASAFLTRCHERLQKGLSVPEIKVNIVNSTFVLPTDNTHPIIMVGPGAGIAPFRGFLEEKHYLLEKGLENPYGDLTLFFGCRGSNWDYLYRDELTTHAESKLLHHLFLAFSREKEKKIYVQDLVEEHKKMVMKALLEDKGTLYICGSMAMGKAVIKRLSEIVSLYHDCPLAEGEEKVIEMEKQKKIIKELWG